MNGFESAPQGISPIEPEPETIAEAVPVTVEKKEKFEEFDLQPGDRIVYDTRKGAEKQTVEPTKDYYEIRRVENDGYGRVFLQKYEYSEREKRMKIGGSELEVSFTWILEQQSNFLSIDQPRLPEGQTLRDYATGGRPKIILDGIEGKADDPDAPENIGTLKDPNLIQSERDRLIVAKVNLVRQILERLKQV